MELCRRAGISHRTLHHAASSGLIRIRGESGKGHHWQVDEEEAERVEQAARLARRYEVPMTTMLRWQLEGRIGGECDGHLLLAAT